MTQAKNFYYFDPDGTRSPVSLGGDVEADESLLTS
jgi:hypothetical protein